ncbi:MAG: flagellar basal-body rod protein FlgG [Nitrospinaceae bacterium]|nr:flagellar basal-body rod protein FlgG [Nitrospinaceae bacterium]
MGTLSNAGNQIPTGIQLGLGVKPAAIQKIFLQGDFTQTQNPLDIAIEGKGFFQILQPNGQFAYTRAGTFKLDSLGRIVTSEGLLVQPVTTIPIDAITISIDPTGNISVTQPGNQVPAVVGTLQMATFQNAAGLQAVGNNLFLETGSSGPPIVGAPGLDDRGTLRQGFLELSNVSVVEELVNLITAQRAYEVNSRTVQTADEMLQIASNLKR